MQLTLPLFGNYVTIFLFMFQEPGQSVHISKANTFLQGWEEKGLHNRAPLTNAILYKHLGTLWGVFHFALMKMVIAQVVSIPCCTTETRGRRPQSFIPLLFYGLLLAQHEIIIIIVSFIISLYYILWIFMKLSFIQKPQCLEISLEALKVLRRQPH